MAFEPTPRQVLLLWDVLARGGAVAQAKVPKAETRDRAALVEAGLLSAPKVGRSIWLRVEEAGWAWANDHLDAPLTEPAPPGKSAAPSRAETLQLLLTRFGAVLRASDRVLADVLPQAAVPERAEHVARPRAERKPKTAAPRPPKPGKSAPGAIEKKLRGAVARLQGSPQRDGVRLGAMREALPGISRADLDEALVGLFEAGTINLMSLDNPREIERERAAAIDYKGRLLQVLWIR